MASIIFVGSIPLNFSLALSTHAVDGEIYNIDRKPIFYLVQGK